MKRLLFLIAALIVFYGSSYLALNWNYLPFIYKGFDRNFNAERVKIGQTIIEDYFIPKCQKKTNLVDTRFIKESKTS